MERSAAIKKLGKILGKSLGYRVDPKAPDQEGRDEAMAKLRDARPLREALNSQMEARRRAILQADPEYQQLKASHAAAQRICEELAAITGHYRITVGTTSSMFFHVKAQGDSWEQVINKLTEKAS